MARALPLLILFLSSLAFAGPVDDEIGRIPLISTSRYDPQKDERRGWRNRFTKISAYVFGDIAVKYFMDLSKDLSSELDGPDLKAYFASESDRKKLVDEVMTHVNRNIFADGVDNSSAREAVIYIGNQLIGSIAEKVWKSEGATDEARLRAWRKKILSPMNRCFAVTETYTEAQSCIEAVKTDLISNIGMVLAYELTRQEIAPRAQSQSLREQLPEMARTTFWSCKTQRGGAVDACVLSGVRAAIRSVADETLTSIMKESKFSQRLQTTVKQSTLPGFDRCLTSARNKEQILACSDKLTQDAGGEISFHSVQLKLAGSDSIPQKKKDETARFARTEFMTCFVKLKNTDACSKVVTNKVIRQVVEIEFAATVAEKLPGDDKSQALTLARSELNRCWDDNASAHRRESCLRSGVKTLTIALTKEILKKEATPAALTATPDLVERVTQTLPECLDQNLPANISESKNLEAQIGKCTGPLTREAALLVARAEVKSALSGNLPEVEVARVIERRVDGKFATCLGPSPTSPKLAECTFQLKTDVARLAPRRIFQAEVEKIAKDHSTPEIFQSKAIKDGLEKIYSIHATCINTNADPNNAKTTDKAIDSCLRDSVQRFALLIARSELEVQAKDLQESRNNVVNEQMQSLQGCLDHANKAAENLSAFTTALDRCTFELRRSASLAIGSALSSEEANRQLGNDDVVKPYQLSFAQCLKEETVSEQDLKKCVDSFKIQVTREIVNATVRKEVAANLGKFEQLPEPFRSMEESYSKCANQVPSENLDENLNACTRDQVLRVTSEIAERKLTPALKSTLGSKEYEIIHPEVMKAKARFDACLNGFRKELVMARVTAGAGSCANQLQADAVGLVQRRIREWVADPDDTPEDRRLADLFISGVPCLDGLMPSDGPMSEGAQEAVDSSLKATMALIVKSLKYDPKKSADQLPDVLIGLIQDLKKLGSDQARRNLVANLIQSGMLDQLIKSVVRSNLIDTFKEIPAEDRLDPRFVQALTSVSNLEKVFAQPEQMERLRTMVAKGVLEPILLQGASMDSAVIQAANNEIKREVTMQLVNSEHFGNAIIGFTVQQKLDNMGAFTRFFARILYGDDSLDWQKVRSTSEGREAEEYIRNSLLKPKFFSEKISDEADRMAKAEDLVTKAVKKTPRRAPASHQWTTND